MPTLTVIVLEHFLTWRIRIELLYQENSENTYCDDFSRKDERLELHRADKSGGVNKSCLTSEI